MAKDIAKPDTAEYVKNSEQQQLATGENDYSPPSLANDHYTSRESNLSEEEHYESMKDLTLPENFR